VVRVYSFMALCERENCKLFPILSRMLVDQTMIASNFGLKVDHRRVGDLVLEIGWQYLSKDEQEEIIHRLLSNQNLSQLAFRYTIVSNLTPREKRYSLLHQLAAEGDYAAKAALANYPNHIDESNNLLDINVFKKIEGLEKDGEKYVEKLSELADGLEETQKKLQLVELSIIQSKRKLNADSKNPRNDFARNQERLRVLEERLIDYSKKMSANRKEQQSLATVILDYHDEKQKLDGAVTALNEKLNFLNSKSHELQKFLYDAKNERDAYRNMQLGMKGYAQRQQRKFEVARTELEQDSLKAEEERILRMKMYEQARTLQIKKPRSEAPVETERDEPVQWRNREGIQLLDSLIEENSYSSASEAADACIQYWLETEPKLRALYGENLYMNDEIELLEEDIQYYNSKIEEYMRENAGSEADQQRRQKVDDLQQQVTMTKSTAESYGVMYKDTMQLLDTLADSTMNACRKLELETSECAPLSCFTVGEYLSLLEEHADLLTKKLGESLLLKFQRGTTMERGFLGGVYIGGGDVVDDMQALSLGHNRNHKRHPHHNPSKRKKRESIMMRRLQKGKNPIYPSIKKKMGHASLRTPQLEFRSLHPDSEDESPTINPYADPLDAEEMPLDVQDIKKTYVEEMIKKKYERDGGGSPLQETDDEAPQFRQVNVRRFSRQATLKEILSPLSN